MTWEWNNGKERQKGTERGKGTATEAMEWGRETKGRDPEDPADDGFFLRPEAQKGRFEKPLMRGILRREKDKQNRK